MVLPSVDYISISPKWIAAYRAGVWAYANTRCAQCMAAHGFVDSAIFLVIFPVQDAAAAVAAAIRLYWFCARRGTDFAVVASSDQ